MAQNVPPLARLIEQFERLPGIGRKSAQRLAYHILNMTAEEAKSFAENIVFAHENIKHCKICCDLTDKEICSVCSNDSRDKSIICVVEDSKDVAAIERTHEFSGLYHVLHGVISPMNNIGPGDIKIKELIERLGDDDIKEIIMATNPTVEGEATAMYISRLIKPMGLTVSRLAYGVPVGSDLEYADEVTLSRAIEGRKEI
ncbi:MAG TPA: recombination mediator RecR [Clostridiales bacterium]|jgi:recombination protein RecR|nr:recombination mediator RecR [Clostridiales bacterium]HRT81621.1 recombination mediator RecR [Oscillospiraceae bacterium]